MDLKTWDKAIYFLVLVDVATRYCQAVMIKNKRPETIISAIFSKWISVFGVHWQFLTDNGGEFNNSYMKSMSDNFGINLMCTAAEAPFINGLVERLNAILTTSVRKLIYDLN